MGLKTAFSAGLAAVVAVGAGSAADAATTVNFKLRYEGGVLERASIVDDATQEELWRGDLSIEESPWAVPFLYPGAKKGDIYYASAVIEDGDDGYGYVASSCNVGGFDCSIWWWERNVSIAPLTVEGDAFGVWQDGLTLTVKNWGEYHLAGFEIIGDGYSGYTEAMIAKFTILAPVPLPATAVLLPLGLGALALMRRRRKA